MRKNIIFTTVPKKLLHFQLFLICGKAFFQNSIFAPLFCLLIEFSILDWSILPLLRILKVIFLISSLLKLPKSVSEIKSRISSLSILISILALLKYVNTLCKQIYLLYSNNVDAIPIKFNVIHLTFPNFSFACSCDMPRICPS